MTDSASFDAKFTCTSRLPSTGIVNPFMIRFATENTYLPYETEISNLLNGLALGSVSKITNIYTVPTGSTDISCAVKIGTGYSTNSACTARACVGADCLNHPDTFSVVSSGTDLCTSQPNEVYNI